MKRNLLKIMSLILCISMLAAPLAGCSPKNSGNDDPKPSTNNNKLPKLEKLAGKYTDYQLEQVREKIAAKEEPWKSAYDNLINYIKKHFDDEFNVDEDFNVPGYYDDPKGHAEAKERLNATGCMSYACALAYVFSGNDQYATKASKLLSAWAEKNKFISGADGALAMCVMGPSLMYAAELLTASNGWKNDAKEIFTSWVEAVFLPTANSIRERENNWGDWGILASVAAYNFLGNLEEVENCMLLMRSHIDSTILPTGEMPHETKRETNGIWYTYFALAPMTTACEIIYNATGYDLFSHVGSQGQSIEKALDYLLYYAKNPKEWPHYDGNQSYTTSSDYPYNLFEAMGVIYNNEEYTAFGRQKEINTVLGHHYAWSFSTLTTIYE